MPLEDLSISLQFPPPAARVFIFHNTALLTVYLKQRFLLRSQLLNSTVRSSRCALHT